MNFGKNRVQYDKFEWYYYRYDRFDSYFYLGGNELAIASDSIVNATLNEFELFFGQKISNRLIFILYQNLSDFRQSNIGLKTVDNENNLGGVIKISDNVVSIYNEGSLEQFTISIREAIAKIILQEMIYGSNLRSKVANNALISVPDWYIDGLAKYVASPWNTDDDNNSKNILQKLKFKNITYLPSKDKSIVGKSIWNYISIIYGKKTIPNLVYLTRVSKNIENGFLYVLGTPYANFQKNWLNFYTSQYKDFDINAEDPNANNDLLVLNKKSKKNVEYSQIVNSSNANKIAWVENNLGRYKIKVYDKITKKTSCIYKREHRLEQITDYSYPILRWHPSGKILGAIVEKKGEIFLLSYNFEDEKISENEIASLEKITGFDYSNDGQYVVFSAFDNGQSDIFLFNLAANSIENITQDIYDDYSPSYITNSNKIIYTSKKEIYNTTNNKNTDIFTYDIKSKKIEQITNTKTISEKNPFFFNNSYIYLSDKNGVYNLYSSQIDSSISFIDTITHYQKFLTTKQLTNYKNNISDFSLDRFSNENSFVYKNNNKYSLLYANGLPENTTSTSITMTRKMLEENSIENSTQKINIIVIDTIAKINLNTDPLEEQVNINNYRFSSKSIESNNNNKELSKGNEEKQKKEQEKNRLHKYFTTFYTNHLLAQIDMGFLNNSYQKFTGSAYYFNPGFNLITSVSTYDLFEDYRISAAARFAGNFDSNEYLFTFESLKKRWDKQFVFHRQILKEITNYNYQIKTSNHEVFYVMNYPFSQVSAVKFTANLRMDRLSFSSLDIPSLLEKDSLEFWGGLKAEYIFDNSKLISKNIPSGSKIKIFGEFFNMLNKRNTDLFVLGADVRYYLPIYKNFIFAARLGVSYSFGHSKLIYYLGSIDNWINFSRKIPTFDGDTRIDSQINYQYQAVATNLRGFSQNIRNGSNFAVINAELRLPIFSLLYPRPINNSFLRDFQIIAFFDIGSAWNGLHPFLNNNAYQNDVYDYNSISVTIYNNNFPIVSGYGFGVRTSIFQYFIRADYAWGINNNNILSPIFYLSLGLDF